MKFFVNLTQLQKMRVILFSSMLLITAVFLFVPAPPGLFTPVFLGLLALWLVSFGFEKDFGVEDIPFLFLVTATFTFGRAVSVIPLLSVGDIPIPITETVLAVSLFLMLFKWKGVLKHWAGALPMDLKILLPGFLALGSLYLVLGLKNNGAIAFRDIVFCHYMLFLFITLNVLKNSHRIKRTLTVFIPGAVVLLVIGFIMDFITKSGQISFIKFLHDSREFNWALYYGLTAIFALCFFTFHNKKVSRWAKGIFIYFGLLLMVLTAVRAGWVAIVPTVILLFILLKKEVRIFLIIIPLLAVSIFLIDYYIKGNTVEMIKKDMEGMVPGKKDTLPKMNVAFRLMLWEQTLDKIHEKPVLGWGYGSYPQYYIYKKPLPHPKGIGPGSRITPAHNHVLAVTYKMGLLGLILFLFINIRVFFLGALYVRKCQSAFNRRFLTAALGGMMYWHGMALFFDMLESPPTGIFIWILLGAVMAVVYADKNADKKDKNSPQNTRNTQNIQKNKPIFETKPLFGINYAIVDYERASDVIVEYAENHRSFGVSALAVHGLVTSVRDTNVGDRVKKIDMVVPDGQPVRWALNSIYKVGLADRVYGPTLTLHVLEKADKIGLNVYLYGSTEETLAAFSDFIKTNYPGVNLCGIHSDRFRDATPGEDVADIEKINAAGAHIVLVGRGCPRQEVWVADHLGSVHAAMMAVGAAFDFHAGTLEQAPKWMQDRGLEWLYRLVKEPRRLWKRYFVTNSYFIYLYLKHKLLPERHEGTKD